MEIFNVILYPFAWLLRTLYFVLGNYGLAIIVFCLISKVVLFPISLKGKKSMVRMSALTSQQQAIQKKYAGDKNKINLEIQKLYEREKINPLGGCIWSLLPLPVLIALYSIIRKPLYYMMSLTADQVNELSNFLFGKVISSTNTGEITIAQELFRQFDAVKAALPDIADKIFRLDFSFLGLDLAAIPQWNILQYGTYSWANIGLFLLPIISAAISYVSMKYSMKSNNTSGAPQEGSVAATNKSMTLMMPIISLWIGFTLPASLGVYWIANSVFMIIQEWITNKLIRKDVAAEAARAAERERLEKEQEEERKKKNAANRAKSIADKERKNQFEQVKQQKKDRQQGKTDGEVMEASRVGLRAYARGRAYDPNRYAVTPYADSAAAKDNAGEAQSEEKDTPELDLLTPSESMPVQPELPSAVSEQEDDGFDTPEETEEEDKEE
ncbi:Membrane protein insertase YidC [bioreactor metagenome]|uniref:Membrane protein insertase YidC n=1 Tax=bioreactor metagenome TaxID=1076179 RepID=A0A644WHD9_9ZZZZ